MAYGDTEYPSGFGYQDLVAWGNTGFVVLDRRTHTVIKSPFSKENEQALQRERQVYERLTAAGKHDNILTYYGVYERGIRLEYAANHDLRSFFSLNPVDPRLPFRWVTQLASALVFIHKAGIIHGDLTACNVFLDADLNVKLGDFAGSSIDSSPFLVAIRASHEYPGDVMSEQGDIFALGSTMYEVIAGRAPYSGLEDSDIRALFRQGEFPELTSWDELGKIIMKCWLGSYNHSEALLSDINVSIGLQLMIIQYQLEMKLGD